MGPPFPGFPTCLFMIPISSCFKGKNPKSIMWFHLSIAKHSHSGCSKPGHEGLLGLGVTETPSEEALRGAQREALGAVPPHVLTPQRLALAGREGKCSAAGARGPVCTQSPFFPSVIQDVFRTSGIPPLGRYLSNQPAQGLIFRRFLTCKPSLSSWMIESGLVSSETGGLLHHLS